MNRIKIFVSAMCLFLLFLTACGSSKGESQENQSVKISESGKKVITLSMGVLDMQLEKAVDAFNRTNAKYEVEIITLEENSTMEEYIERENVALTTSSGPDLFCKTGFMDFTNFIDKGIMENLTPYIERDLKAEDYVESALYAYAVDENIYAIPMNFCLNLMVTDESLLGNPVSTDGWTYKDIISAMENNPHLEYVTGNDENSEILRILVGLGGISYTDFEAIKECILFADKYQGSLPDEEDIVLGKNVLVSEVQIGNALAWADIRMYYGDNVVPIGYPRQSGSGIRHGSQGISMNANSDNKEGAWEFIKFLLSEEYQNRLETWFSPLKSVFERQLTTYLTPSSFEVYIEEIGETVTGSNPYYLPNSGEYIDCMTGEQINELRHMVEVSDSFVFDMNFEAWLIISEEAEAYFNGQRDIDGTMNNIENRINLYMSEKE